MIAWGPQGVLVLAVLDSAGIPLPAGVDALLVFVAAMDPGAAYLSAGLAVLGSVIGSMILFFIARKGGELYLDARTISGMPARFRRWFLRYGLLTIFIPALIPVPLPLKVFVLSAGALGVRPLSFLLVILGARVPRYFGLAYLGSQLGEHSLAYIQTHWLEMLLIAVGLFLVLFALLRLRDARRSVTA